MQRSVPLLAPLAAAVAAACGGPTSQPTWVDLAQGFRPQPIERLVERLEARVEPPREWRVVRPEGTNDPWFEVPLPAAAWSRGTQTAEWRTTVPVAGALLICDPRSIVLASGAKTWRKSIYKRLHEGQYEDHYLLDGADIRAFFRTSPPEDMVCRARLDTGHDTGGRWRIEQTNLSCSGILVFPGEPEALSCEIPPGSRLCFATVAPDPGAAAAEPTTFRVTLDGRTLFEHTQVFQRPLSSAWHRVDPGTAGSHRLAFEVDGPWPALFAAPVLAPRDIGRPGERPWPETRPDLVLVVVDTFRADNMAEWGGSPALTPNLNALAERSLRFLDARATAAWTLPSIGSLMSGVFPAQHGGTDRDRPLVEQVETLAEVLSAAGYRTAAVTDSGFFSREFGQDQGFEWFEEATFANWNLNHTLAKARQQMAADDGRPLFLVVHTYRVHGPLRTGSTEDGGPWQKILGGILEKRRERRRAGLPVREDRDPEHERIAREFYFDAVRDLDRKLGTWFDELTREGFFERGVLALTSDHGQAHGEHGEHGHGAQLFDVKLRVPLLLAGRGITPRAARGTISLIDVAPTFAALAETEPSPTWLGRSLLEDGPSRPHFAFDLKEVHRQVALYVDGRKIMAPDLAALEQGRPTHAFDLEQDPLEEENLVERADWPAELSRQLSGALEPLLVPAARGEVLQLSPELDEQLRAIGYGN